jgi:hypothetical protein
MSNLFWLIDNGVRIIRLCLVGLFRALCDSSQFQPSPIAHHRSRATARGEVSVMCGRDDHSSVSGVWHGLTARTIVHSAAGLPLASSHCGTGRVRVEAVLTRCRSIGAWSRLTSTKACEVDLWTGGVVRVRSIVPSSAPVDEPLCD